MPLGRRGTHADQPNLVPIMNAVHDIAAKQSGIDWGATYKYEFPDSTILATDQDPILVVAWPVHKRYQSEDEPTGTEMYRQLGGAMSETESVYDIVVWGCVAYSPAWTKEQREEAFEAALGLYGPLHAAFHLFYGLEDAERDLLGNIADPKPVMKIQPNPGQWFCATRLSVRAYETLYADMTQPPGYPD